MLNTRTINRSWAIAMTVGIAGLWMVRAAPAQPATALPPDSAYVVVNDGHLSVDGQRQRYWSAIGKLYISAGVKASDSPDERRDKVAKARAGTDAIIARLKDLGFNSVRFWRGYANSAPYQAGDGSDADAADYFIAQAGKAGFRVWCAGMNNAGAARLEDADVIDDPATAQAWRDAIAEMSKKDKGGKIVEGWNVRSSIARFWDPRIEKIGIHNMTAVATHLNPHNGLRWCDDPTFGVWELSNEEWWMRKMVGGQWQKLPAFFRNSLIARWNAYLKAKYNDDAALTAAWGKLLEGESLASGSVLLIPTAGKSKVAVTLNDASEVAKAAVQQVDESYSREDFDPRRGADVLEFFVNLQLSHKQREAAAIKPLGKSTRLSPMIYDTGIGYEIQSQWLHQNADAVAHDAYVNGVGPTLDEAMKRVESARTEHLKDIAIQDAERISVNTGQWVNWLLKPPGISQGVPWLEHNKVEGKPFFAYETQIQQPAKYRADFPLRIAALAGIQDWDWICWHYFAPGDDVGEDPESFVRPMDITTGSHPQGYHYTFDEVQNAAMRAAGYMFRTGELSPAPKPTKFIFGRKSLYDPASMDYAGSYGKMGLDMLYTTYQYGVRIEIDPNREDDQVIGPVVKFEDRNTHNPYTPTDQITFDHKKGYLMIDSPAAKAFTGLLARYGDSVKFDGGVMLDNVSIDNPPGMYDPVGDDEKYITFALASEDGKPLGQTKAATLALVSTSFNSGFRREKINDKTVTKRGDMPVLVARVGATVQSGLLDGMSYTFRDWSMKPIGQGVVKDGKLVIPSDQPIFVVELRR